MHSLYVLILFSQIFYVILFFSTHFCRQAKKYPPALQSLQASGYYSAYSYLLNQSKGTIILYLYVESSFSLHTSFPCTTVRTDESVVQVDSVTTRSPARMAAPV